MTTKKDDSQKDAGRPADPKKPYATIDLKATEVVSEAAKSATAAAAASSATSAAAAPAAAAAGAKTPEAPKEAPKADVKADAAKTDPKAAASAASDKDKDKAAKKPDTAAAPVAPPAKARGGIGGFFTHLAAGVVGGFLALLGADTIAPKLTELGLPVGSSGLGQPNAEVQKRLTAIEQALKAPQVGADLSKKVAGVEGQLGKIDELRQQLAKLAESQAKLEGETQGIAAKVAAPAVNPAEQQRIAKLEERLATLAAAAVGDPQAGRLPQLAAITGKLADLETTMNNQIAALRAGVGRDIETRIAQTAEASESARSGTQRLDRDLSTLKTDTARITQRLESIKADDERQTQTLRVVQEELGAVKSGVETLKGDLEARFKAAAKPADVAAAIQPVTTKLGALETSVQGVVKAEEDRRTNAERIVLSLELANLKRALDRGQTYAAELAEVRKAAGGKIDLAALEKFKDKGVPTVAELARDFRPLIHAIADAQTEPADASVLDRLMSGAKSVVRVRKVNHASDDKSAEAIAGRMEAALKDGRLAEVIEQAKSLSPKAALPAHDWMTKVEARHAVDRAIGAIEGQLKASLSTQPAADKASK